jgi:hypothetical protein
MTTIYHDHDQDIRSGRPPLLESIERLFRNSGIVAPIDVCRIKG